MKDTLVIILLIGLIAVLSCSNVAGRRIGKRDYCQLSPERGRCRASFSKWYYDSASGECRNFTWGGCGGNSNKFATKSFCERVCQNRCRHSNCSTTCPNGFIIDSNGCNTCRCQPGSEQASCPAIECDTRCPQGYQTDSDGCMTCNCRATQAEQVSTRVGRAIPKNQCPPVCYMFCQFGNKQDENGCDICSCRSKEEVCGSQQCMMECPTGFATDDRGCELCRCNSAEEAAPICPSNQCLKYCRFGYKKDSFGCDTCACAAKRQRNRQTSDCSNRPMCTLYCPNGFVKGSDGCDVCRCAEERTTRRQSRYQSRSGKGSSSSSADACGVRPMCNLFCLQGFQKDSKGCDICACRPDPPVHAAQLPAGISGGSPSQLPANIPAQLPAQLPVNIPSQLPAETPSQLPANVPAQLPADVGCTVKRCHKRMRCAFGFAKDEFGCDTCVCSNTRSRATPRRRQS